MRTAVILATVAVAMMWRALNLPVPLASEAHWTADE